MTKRKATYRVLAPTGYAGHAQGEEFTAALTPDQERRAIARGSLKPVEKRKDDERHG